MQAGLAGVHGNVSSFGSANGISVVALADFGKPGVGGVDGSSGATGKSSSGGSIRGDAYLKAGDGSGDLSIDARASPAKA